MSATKKNEKWFSRKGAFTYLEDDLESKERINKVIGIFRKYKSGSKPPLLDIGCGDGQVGQNLVNLGYEIYGIDISKRLLSEAQKRGLITILADIANEKLPIPDEVFNYVFCGETIEHIINTEKIMKEIRRVLKKNGLVVITTPNLVHLPDRITFLKGQSPSQIQPLHEYIKLHTRQFTHGSWGAILQEFGFEVVESCSSIVVFERDSKDTSKVLRHSKWLSELWPSLGASVIVTARKQ